MRSLGTNINTNVNGLMVSYNDEGPVGAPVVLFIHGFPLNKSMWNAQFEALKPTYRVIAYDVRGHGNSEAGTEDFSIELFVEDLLGFMDTLQLDQVILCGLSMGGYIALSAIEKHPERFIGLVLSDTQCLADTPEAIAKRMAAIESIREKGAELYVEQSIQNLFAAASFHTKQMEIGSVKEMMNKTTAQSMCNTLHALAVRKETCSKLSELTIPIQILVGKEDKITPPKVARLMLDKTQHSTLVIVEHAGHLANIENPHQFNQQLMNFMDRYFPIDMH